MKWRPLPDGKEDYLALLRLVLKNWYSKPREGWHVSDIVMCPRQRVFRHLNPTSPTDREVNMYSSGKSMHEAIQILFMSNRMRFEVEKYVEHEGIVGSIDIFDKATNQPLEFKTLNIRR